MRVWQAVAAFDLGKEALGDEEALLFKGGRKHHIGPQDDGPASWRGRRKERRAAPDARKPRARRRATDCGAEGDAKENKDRTTHS